MLNHKKAILFEDYRFRQVWLYNISSFDKMHEDEFYFPTVIFDKWINLPVY
jgi:hypothetical protein